jgi:hypothetical protein
MFAFMVTGERGENTGSADRPVIIVGVDDRPRPWVAAQWAVRERPTNAAVEKITDGPICPGLNVQ